MKFIEKILSLKNSSDGNHKILNFVGIKLKFRRKKLASPHIPFTIKKIKKIKDIKYNDLCIGCSACKNICKHNAITMAENEEGFLMPVIDEDKCTDCGVCNVICPIINFKEKPLPKDINCFAAYSDDHLRSVTSSGGIFPVLASYFLQQGDYVCGAVYQNNFQNVEHVIISDINDLNALLLSKYVQSDLKSVYPEIRHLLKRNKKVLFVGTPCQVAGLKAFLRREYENLFLVDLVCCGIPSRKVYRKYLKEIIDEPSEKLIDVKFRLKDKGWHSRAIEITTDKTKYRIPNSQSAYMQAFFRGIGTNKICTMCPYDTTAREGDITLGDFWGINRHKKEYDDDKGTSLLLTNSEKGKKLVEFVKDKLNLIKKADITWALKDNANLIKPISHNTRRQFFSNLDKMSIESNYVSCILDKCDCAILNNAITGVNYGSLLTAYAAQEVMAELGLFAKIINHTRVPIENYENSFAKAFADEYLNLTSLCQAEDDYYKLNDKTNVFFVGSDQVWNMKYYGHQIDKVLLNFVQDDKLKISLAASFGLDEFEGTEEQKKCFSRSLRSFNAISTREDSGVEICKSTFNQMAEWILDPVFILNREKYADMTTKSDFDCSGKLVYYSWSIDEDFISGIDHLSKRFDAESLNITNFNLDVEDWLMAIKTCKCFVSNSYHGICFAIIFNKPFICINNLSTGRFRSLNKLLDFSDHIIDDISDIYIRENIYNDIDYDSIDKILEMEKEKSRSFIKNALKIV